MQPADLRNDDDLSQFRRLHGPWMRGVLAERQMRSRLVIVIEIRTQISTQRCFAADDQMNDTLAANRPDDAFHIGTLPGRPGRRKHFLDFQLPDLAGEIVAEDARKVKIFMQRECRTSTSLRVRLIS